MKTSTKNYDDPSRLDQETSFPVAGIDIFGYCTDTSAFRSRAKEFQRMYQNTATDDSQMCLHSLNDRSSRARLVDKLDEFEYILLNTGGVVNIDTSQLVFSKFMF